MRQGQRIKKRYIREDDMAFYDERVVLNALLDEKSID